jgi:hypothetical protein
MQAPTLTTLLLEGCSQAQQHRKPGSSISNHSKRQSLVR